MDDSGLIVPQLFRTTIEKSPNMSIPTILHISDLHLGDIHLLTKASYSDPTAVTAANFYQYLPGNLGHSDRALAAVSRLYRGLLRENPEVRLIVSGDVTAFGKDAHFDLADEYLRGSFNWPGTRRALGLRLAGLMTGMVPGNHDYFAGVPLPIGRPTKVMRSFFGRSFPASGWEVHLSSSRVIRFLEIDCDEDFNRNTKPRLTARESGVTNLQKLSSDLQKLPLADEVRILIMHGSPSHKDGVLQLLELMHPAHAELDTFCREHRVKLILTGHTHTTNFTPLPFASGSVVEIRCGTSTQVSCPKINPITARLVRRYLSPVHAALVHGIDELPDGRVLWRTKVHNLLSTAVNFREEPASYVVPLW